MARTFELTEVTQLQTSSSKQFVVKSLHRDYPVCVSESIESLTSNLEVGGDTVFVVDKTVGMEYEEQLLALIQDRPKMYLDSDETVKTLEGIERLIEWLMSLRCNKSTHIVAIGGGIVQDVVAFTSSIYYRGIRYSLVPTTLLSMCDSSIGAKCGINFKNFKNQLGVVYAPYSVHIATEFLRTLNDREIQSGYGEILKLAITGGPENLEKLESHVNATSLRDAATELIYDCLLVKKTVIEIDEYESDYRRVLNYGHTFGHALEAFTEHEIPHGLGVAWGIDVINFIASQVFDFDKNTALRIRSFIKDHLFFQLSRIPTSEDLLKAAQRDKKMVGSKLNIVVPVKLGKLQIVPVDLSSLLQDLLDNYLSSENVFGTPQE
jgi:3-dehydroquinate synthase